MASVIAGFRPVKHLNGSPYNGQVNRYMTAAADAVVLNVGDLVILGAGAAIVDPVTGGVFPVVSRAQTATTDALAAAALVGAVVGFEPDYSNLNLTQVRLASTRRIALVSDSPDILYAAPQDGGGGVIAAASVGLTVGIVCSGVPVTTGAAASTMMVDSSDVGSTTTRPLQIMGITAAPDNDVTSTARPAEVLVRINTPAYAFSVAGV